MMVKTIQVTTLPEQLTLVRGEVVFIHRVLHPILSKRDLVVHYDLPDNRSLRRKVLTPEVLKEAMIKAEDLKHIAVFDAATSRKLYEALGIEWLRTAQKPHHHVSPGPSRPF